MPGMPVLTNTVLSRQQPTPMSEVVVERKTTRLGIYCPGNGTGGPWRYVHSVLAGLDPDEFDVTVFCDLPGGSEPEPWMKVVQLKDDPGGPPTTAPVPAAGGAPTT